MQPQILNSAHQRDPPAAPVLPSAGPTQQGPVFPPNTMTNTNISRRDFFAAHALAGLLANSRLLTDTRESVFLRTDEDQEAFAHRLAVQAADELIRELDQAGGSK